MARSTLRRILSSNMCSSGALTRQSRCQSGGYTISRRRRRRRRNCRPPYREVLENSQTFELNELLRVVKYLKVLD